MFIHKKTICSTNLILIVSMIGLGLLGPGLAMAGGLMVYEVGTAGALGQHRVLDRLGHLARTW